MILSDLLCRYQKRLTCLVMSVLMVILREVLIKPNLRLGLQMVLVISIMGYLLSMVVVRCCISTIWLLRILMNIENYWNLIVKVLTGRLINV